MSFFTEELFHSLLEHEESCWLDFKREIHSNKDELLKDILALANADHQSDRYLLFGIQDGNKNEIGLNLKETWVTKEENFLSWFRKCTFNHRPSVQFKFLSFEDKLFACLRIENQPYKPYFSTKDNTKDNHIIWTREDHTNQKADDGDMQRMWRERFGLDKSIKERFFLYLEDFENWTKTDNSYEYFYYNDFPEFTLEDSGKKAPTIYWEYFAEDPSITWLKHTSFETGISNRSIYQLKYHSTLIKEMIILAVENGKYQMPNPTFSNSIGSSYFSRSSLEYKVAKLLVFNRSNSLDSILALTNLPIED